MKRIIKCILLVFAVSVQGCNKANNYSFEPDFSRPEAIKNAKSIDKNTAINVLTNIRDYETNNWAQSFIYDYYCDYPTELASSNIGDNDNESIEIKTNVLFKSRTIHIEKEKWIRTYMTIEYNNQIIGHDFIMTYTLDGDCQIRIFDNIKMNYYCFNANILMSNIYDGLSKVSSEMPINALLKSFYLTAVQNVIKTRSVFLYPVDALLYIETASDDDFYKYTWLANNNGDADIVYINHNENDAGTITWQFRNNRRSYVEFIVNYSKFDTPLMMISKYYYLDISPNFWPNEKDYKLIQ